MKGRDRDMRNNNRQRDFRGRAILCCSGKEDDSRPGVQIKIAN